jgi:hypothetical protein
MDSPMTWGDYLTIEVLIPGAIAAGLGLIVFVAFARDTIAMRRKANAAMAEVMAEHGEKR